MENIYQSLCLSIVSYTILIHTLQRFHFPTQGFEYFCVIIFIRCQLNTFYVSVFSS
jgi:hypothetical protein